MEQEEKIILFQSSILLWFSENGRKFPWRNKSLNNYQIIMSEVLLQRTKAETVSKFYDPFISTYPNWKSLVTAEITDLITFLKPLGLSQQRSKRLKKLAVEMVRRNGRLPKLRTELDEIPFIGQYIGNAIELLIFDKPSVLMDVNMSRVLERNFGKRKKADIRYDHDLQSLAYQVANHPKSKQINWGILDFAALVCRSKNPLCIDCILNTHCLFIMTEEKFEDS